MITLGGDAELELVTWHSRFFGIKIVMVCVCVWVFLQAIFQYISISNIYFDIPFTCSYVSWGRLRIVWLPLVYMYLHILGIGGTWNRVGFSYRYYWKYLKRWTPVKWWARPNLRSVWQPKFWGMARCEMRWKCKICNLCKYIYIYTHT